MRIVLGIVALASVFSVCAVAAEEKEGGPSDKPWAKSDGGFGAMLHVIEEPENFFEDWERPGRAVRIPETRTAEPGVPIAAVIVFTGCAPDAKGNCQSTIEFAVYRPGGKPYGEPIEVELWTDKRPPSRRQLQLGVGNLGIILNPEDPLGVYTVKAKVVDHVAKKTLLLERMFSAVEPIKLFP